MKKFIQAGLLAVTFYTIGLFSSSTVYSGDKNQQPEMSPEAAKAMKEMAACMKANELTEKHSKFKEMEGNWNIKQKLWMYPGADAMEATGKAKFTVILNGRFVKQEYSCNMMGMPYNAVGYDGYDTIKKEYVSIWMGDNGNHIGVMKGNYQSDGNFIATGFMPDALNPDKDKKMKTKVQHHKDGSIVFEMFVVEDKDEFRMMEITYTRAM